MSTVGTITRLATEVVGKTAHAVTHPVRTATTVTGQARRAAASVIGGGRTSETAPSSPASEPKAAATPATKPRPKAGADIAPSPPRNAKPAKPTTPAKSVEPSVTEPKAASRQSAHRGRGAEPTDDWRDELDDGSDLNPATGQPHSTGDEEPLLDPSVTKQVKAEAETMRKASDPSGE